MFENLERKEMREVLEQGKSGKGWKGGKDSKDGWRKRRIKFMVMRKVGNWEEAERDIK
jgi:hypothetical protein